MGDVTSTGSRTAPRVWLSVAVTAWALLLVAAAAYGARVGKPTVREQTTIAGALPAVNRALTAVVGAAAGPETVLSISGYDRITARCDAGNRKGERYQRSVQVYVAPGREGDLVDRVAAALPPSYKPAVRHSPSGPGLRADAGYYVSLTGGMSRAGELRFTADTGCRVVGGSVPAAAEDGGPQRTRESADGPLAKLGAVRERQQVNELACLSGGTVATVSLRAPVPAAHHEMVKLAPALAAVLPTGVTALISRDDLVVYVAQGVGVSVAVTDETITVTATSGCQ
jgi:hypothetical protein